MSHSFPRRRGSSSDKSDYWLFELSFDEIRGLFLGCSSDFTDHNHTVSFRIPTEILQNINEIGTVNGISSDTHTSTLTNTELSQLKYSFISQGSRPRND